MTKVKDLMTKSKVAKDAAKPKVSDKNVKKVSETSKGSILNLLRGIAKK
jgi:hypothetical protein